MTKNSKCNNSKINCEDSNCECKDLKDGFKCPCKSPTSIIILFILILGLAVGFGYQYLKTSDDTKINQKQTAIEDEAKVDGEVEKALTIEAVVEEEMEEQNTFSKDETYGYYGKLVVQGFAQIDQIPESYCLPEVDGECEDLDYIFFNVVDNESKVIMDYFREMRESILVRRSSFRLGCIDKESGVLQYTNGSNELGVVTKQLTIDDSDKILSSTRDNPVTIKLEKLPLDQNGFGLPDCYSDFTYISVF